METKQQRNWNDNIPVSREDMEWLYELSTTIVFYAHGENLYEEHKDFFNDLVALNDKIADLAGDEETSNE